MRKLANFIVNRRYWILVVMLILTALCGFLSTRVETNTDMTRYLPESSNMKQGLDLMDAEFPESDDVDVETASSAQGVPTSVLLTAVGILLVILFVMSASWLEPVLFMVVIGIAIVLNLGTNLVLGYTSTLTGSIAPILQLILSMDYSIMLINRYRQALADADNKYDAMKNALAASFPSIASSALTTVVGLLVLSFLSFKIGLELGVVLAKGVFISMICVFTLLPTLILLCDKGIQKTAKKVPHFKMNGLAKLSYKARFVVPVLFVPLFIGAYALQSSTEITFSQGTEEETEDNTIVLLYQNADEKAVTGLIDELEADSGVKEVSGYPNTLGKAYTAEEMSDTIADLGDDVSLDPSLITMLYYNYFDGSLPEMTASEFLHFLADDVLTNETFSDSLGDDINDNVDTLLKFADKKTLKRKMTAGQLAEFLGMDEADVDQLYLYYFIQNGGVDTGTMTLPTFVNFVVDEVAKDETYGSMFDADTLSQLETLKSYTDAGQMTKKQDYKKIASTLGMDEDTVLLLFVYYQAKNSDYTPQKMTLAAFVSFLQTDVAKNPAFSSYLTKDTLAQVEQLATFTDKNTLTAQLSPAALAAALGMDEETIGMVVSLYYMENAGGETVPPEEQTLSIEQTVNFLLTNETIRASLDEATLASLTTMQGLIAAVVSDTAFTPAQMAGLTGMDEDSARVLFTYKAALDGGLSSWRLSVQTVVNFLVDNQKTFASSLDKSTLASLKTAQAIINNSVSGKAFTPSELSALTGMETAQAEQLYLLYIDRHRDTGSWKLSPKCFVNYLVSDVLTDDDFSGQFDADSRQSLETANKLINAVVSGESYTAQGLAGLVGDLSEDAGEEEFELLLLYNASQENSDASWQLSLLEMVEYLTGDLMEDARFSLFFDSETKSDLTELKGTLTDAVAQLKGEHISRLVITSDYPEESAETTAFMDEIDALREKYLSGDSYVVGSSAMVHEMQQSFRQEFWMISLITAAAIYLVVLLTFRNFVIPLILVLLVQCGVYITVAVIGLRGLNIYYLALLIVQSILMGATIDYAIVFTNYYRDNRRALDRPDALAEAYHGSIHTIMTSGLILIIVTAILGIFTEEQTISQVCTTISIGSLSAVLLIVLILPGILAFVDRVIVKRRNKN